MKAVSAALFVMGLCVGGDAVAAPLWGMAYRKGSHAPVAGATLKVIDSAGTLTGSTVTGPDGRYRIDLPDKERVVVEMVAPGFAPSSPVERDGAGGGEQNFSLEPSVSFTEVEVVADRDPARVAKTVTTGKELSRIPGSAGDPLRGAVALPGVTTSNDAEANPAVRGSGPSDNASFVDRIPLPYLFHMGGLVSVLPAGMVEDFTLYSAAFGPEFGGVTGAVFDVTLRDPRGDRWSGSTGISMMEADLLLEGPVGDDGGVAASVRRSYIDLFLPASGAMGDGVEYRQFPQYSDYLLKGVYRIGDAHDVSILIDGARDEMALHISDEAPAAAHEPVLVGDFSIAQEFHQQGGTLTSRLGAGVNRLTISHATHAASQRLSQLGHALIDTNVGLLRERFDLPAGEGHDLSLGAEYSVATVDLDLDLPNELPNDYDPDVDLTGASRSRYRGTIRGMGYALYLKDRWRIAPSLVVTPGVRYEYGDYLNEGGLLPRIGLEWEATGVTVVTAGWGEYRQDPQGNEMVAVFGNPNLEQTRATHTVVGIGQRFADGWSVKGELYEKRFSRLVVPNDATVYSNDGSGAAQGMELLVRRDGALVSGWISAAYAKTERTNGLTGESFAYRYDQPLIVNAVGSWSPWEDWTVGVRWRYQSGAPFTPITATYLTEEGRIRPVYGPLGSERLPDYHRLDLRVDRTSRYRNWTLGWFVEIITPTTGRTSPGTATTRNTPPANRWGNCPSFPPSA
ncbi:MAG: TonB-dependent receptor [Nitrospinae bacterium]|nr:TonB-dependent receptor [Nitrospinota bacterium]